jgi:hypothetical protein
VNNQKQRYVHALVLEAFVGLCPQGMECRHLNGVRHDNRLANLTWGTYAENNADRVRHGTNGNVAKGEKHPHAKLTTSKVLDIRKRVAEGETARSLALEYGLHEEHVGRIVRRERWKHV